MNVMKTLNVHRIKTPLVSHKKEDVLRELVMILAKDNIISNVEEAYMAVVAREQKGSTGLGGEIAIPHAKTTEVEKVAMAIGIAPDGIAFDSLDGAPAKIFFLILANPEYASLHIEALNEIAHLTRDKAFCQELIRAKSAQEVLSIIQREE
ncbi:PTS sugar transporter subunit IIA [Entomospira culicis]|uniref:PTS sugar transporter subunit IIA n=1 Tax=Entomospira culicis TaxID=2719989 RepID=A0A968GEN5_9SPIO|nr:PTS sugar transporter subunit IIA [Entomospira culicis]NIZ18437.1 PTS sugar transporter subunit IIA [Entomospira culicis]NIZ68653.1 PTS sugar transporter subunit IIA [Entomospira culicis]WDI37252.1 PTS sugar transporter subunit IIA [Entomospira culicis]WDI38881.1 PTS sugar transporter subunit IIA [Entomospira culicis]